MASDLTLGEYSGYASKQDLKDHIDDHNNPHHVTAEQVGLGNVPNVTPTNQQPVFSNDYITKTDGSYDVQNIAYGEKLGLAFQIEDDILDIEGDAATLGKSIGKDAASEKSTFPSLLGLEECRELAAKLTEEAVNAVKPLNGHAFLVELARSLTGRTR